MLITIKEQMLLAAYVQLSLHIGQFWKLKKRMNDDTFETQDRCGRISVYAFLATPRKVFVVEHKWLAQKLQTKLLSAQTEIIQDYQTISSENVTKIGTMDKSDGMQKLGETNCWNLGWESLDGKVVQVWYGADVVLAYLNNNKESSVGTRCFDSLNCTFKWVSTTGSKASAEKSRSLQYPFLSIPSSNWFWTIGTADNVTILRHMSDTPDVNSYLYYIGPYGTTIPLHIVVENLASILHQFCISAVAAVRLGL